MEPIIRIEHLTHTYSAGTPFQRSAVEDVSLDIMPGEFLGIIGHTGSGKSTLLHMMGGLDTPTSGDVIISGKKLSNKSEEQMAIFRRRHIGFVFQNYNLIPILNVVENIISGI